MEFNTDYLKLGFLDNVCEITSEQSLESDINLPDYCPDIQRILKCSVNTNVTSVVFNAGRVTADVNAVLRVLYLGDNGKISGYEQIYPIQKFIDSSKITSDCAVKVNVVTDYVNCRAVNPRRLDVKGMLTFIFRADRRRDENVLCGASGSGIQLKCEEMTAASLIGITEKTFTIGEVVDIGQDKKPIQNVISLSPFTEVKEVKVISNKALVKGNCTVKIYYLAEENLSIEYIEHSMPISQIIELDEIDEKCCSSLKLNVSSCEAITKTDSSGNMKLIDLNLKINASLAAFENVRLNLISDSYSIKAVTENKFKSAEFFEINDTFDTSFINKIVLESIGVTVDCVLAVWCSDIKYNFTVKEDRCVVTGTYIATVIYRDSDGQAGAIQKSVDFDSSVRIANKSERGSVIGSAQICGCSCSVAGDSRLELKTEIIVSGLVMNNNLKKFISEISVNNDAQKKDDSCALTVCFCDEGEQIWNIAKRYNTTVEAVLAENNLSDETIYESCMLMIPGV